MVLLVGFGLQSYSTHLQGTLRLLFRSLFYEDVDDDDNETTSPPRLIMMITGQVGRGEAFNRDGICRNLTSNEGCRHCWLKGAPYRPVDADNDQ